MGIKKILKSVIIIGVVVFLFIFVTSNSKYIWRIFGYSFCEEPNNIEVHGVIKDYNFNQIVLTCKNKDMFKYYSGYASNFDDDTNTLYIGIKFNEYFGYETKEQNVRIEIPCDINSIKKIYLTNSAEQLRIF